MEKCERKYMRTVYIADDGKEFGNEFECEHYEWMLNHPHLKDIKCYDKYGKQLEDIMSDDTYYFVKKIIVPTDECVKELVELVEYTGFCDYAYITEPGIWSYVDSDFNERFVQV